MSISFFHDLGGLFSHSGQLLSFGSLGGSSEVERNPKMSISFFNDLGGLFLHFSFHLKLKIRGFLFTVFLFHQSSENEHNPKMSISFFDDSGGLFLHFSRLLSLRSLSQSSEVEHNPKTSISFFNDLGDLFHILVDFCHSDCLADHQKLNVIQI